MRKADILLIIISPIINGGLTVLLLWRKVNREFPFFFSYVSSAILIGLFRGAVASNYRVYFVTYWGTEVIYIALALLSLQEVFRKVFAAFYEKRWFWLFFPVVVIAISALAVIYRVGGPPGQVNQVMSFIVSMGTAINLVQALLFVLFFVLVWSNGIGWREYPFGIVMGFAAIAIGGFIGNWSRLIFGTKSMLLFIYGPPVAYILAVIVWLNTFLRPPEPEPQWRLKITPEQLLEELRQYSKIMEKLRGRGR